MNPNLNELISIYKNREENVKTEMLMILRNELKHASIDAEIKLKIDFAQKTINYWIEIIDERPNEVFTGNIGNNFSISIFDAMLNEVEDDIGFESKNPITREEQKIKTSYYNILKEISETLGQRKIGIVNFEKTLINLREKCKIVGA